MVNFLPPPEVTICKSEIPKFGAENWEDTYAVEAYPLVN